MKSEENDFEALVIVFNLFLSNPKRLAFLKD